MKIGASRRWKVGGCWLKKCAAQHRLDRHVIHAKNLLVRIDILQKQFERPQPLLDPRNKRLPFLRSKNLREKVAEPRTSSPRTIPRNIERHPHFPHHRLKPLVQRALCCHRHRVEAVKQRTIHPAWRAVLPERFVPCPESLSGLLCIPLWHGGEASRLPRHGQAQSTQARSASIWRTMSASVTSSETNASPGRLKSTNRTAPA